MEEMHDYQKQAVEKIIHNKKLAMWLDMGLGKTRICIEAMKKLGRPKTLVIAPATVVDNVWEQECKKWDKDAKISIVSGAPKKRFKALESKAAIYVISRDNLTWLYENYKGRFDMLIIDESTSFKNVRSKRFKTLKHMLWQFDRIVLLSGTPNPNGYLDLFGQYYILDEGERLGRYITYYKEQYFQGFLCHGIMIYKKPRYGAIDAINEKVKDITYALTASDYLRLPDKINNIIKIKQNEKEKKAYDEMKKHYVLGDNVTAANVAVLYQKLSQMSNGFVYSDDNNIIEIGKSKYETLKELIECNPDNVIVFYSYIRDKKLLLEAGGRLLKTKQDMDDWNLGKIKFAIASPETVGRGINLQHGGHNIIWYSLPWNYEIYTQANARLYRQGQEHPVTITHLITEGTIDEKIMEALKSKKTDIETLINAVKEMIL